LIIYKNRSQEVRIIVHTLILFCIDHIQK